MANVTKYSKPTGMYTLIALMSAALFITGNQALKGTQDGSTFTGDQIITAFNVLLIAATIAAYVLVFIWSKKDHE